MAILLLVFAGLLAAIKIDFRSSNNGSHLFYYIFDEVTETFEPNSYSIDWDGLEGEGEVVVTQWGEHIGYFDPNLLLEVEDGGVIYVKPFATPVPEPGTDDGSNGTNGTNGTNGVEVYVIEGVIYTTDDEGNYVSKDGKKVLTLDIDLVTSSIVYRNKDGTVAYTLDVDAKGNTILYKGNTTEVVKFEQGYLDAKGNVVDANGNVIVDNVVDGDDNDDDAEAVVAYVIEGVIYTRDDDFNLVSQDGKKVLTIGIDLVTLSTVYYNKDGTIAYTLGVDAKGNSVYYKGNTTEVVKFEQGYLDAKGNVVDGNGNVIVKAAGSKILIPTLVVMLVFALLV